MLFITVFGTLSFPLTSWCCYGVTVATTTSAALYRAESTEGAIVAEGPAPQALVITGFHAVWFDKAPVPRVFAESASQLMAARLLAIKPWYSS